MIARACARRAAAPAALALAAALLAGCPIPQPLPDYPEGQPVTPPRIVVDDGTSTVQSPETLVRVPAGCAVAPIVELGASLRDANTVEAVVARWFVNYDPTSQGAASPIRQDEILRPAVGAPDPTLRTVPAFTFRPYEHPPAAGTGGGNAATAGAVHTVELVVSNGFDPSADTVTSDPLPELPYRTPLPRFEIQLYRWVFVTVTPSAAVPCPVTP